MPAPQLYLIDGSAYIFRAFHAIPVDSFKRSDGIHTNAVNGFCNMIMKLIEQVTSDEAEDYVAVVFDASSRTFRNDLYPDYKANRSEPPEELRPQFALVREATRAFNLPCIELEGYEADDLIATYAREATAKGFETVIVSSDKDLMQLVNDSVTMFDPMKDRRIAAAEVAEKFGVAPDRVIDVQALMGDSTDNVPGVPGIGAKTAAQLIGEYGDLDTLLAGASGIRQAKRRENLIAFADRARLSRTLVTLKDDVPTGQAVEEFRLTPPDPATLLAFLRAQEFRTLTRRVEAGFVEAGLMAPPQAEAPPPPPPEAAVYETVQDEAQLAEWIALARERGAVAFDTETTSLNEMRAELVGFSLAVEPGRACYVPLAHVAPGSGGEAVLDLDLDRAAAPQQIPFDRALAQLRELLEDPATLKIGHNIKYDTVVMAGYGIDIAPVDDTMLLSYVCDAGRHKHGMDELAWLHFEHETIKYSDVCGKGKSRIGFAEAGLAEATDYAAEDAEITLRLHRLLKPRLVAERVSAVYETMERPLIPVLAQMERTGIRVDAGRLQRLSGDFEGRMAGYETEIYDLAGERFAIGSPKQLGEILFERMGLEGGRKTRTGAWGTGADVLESLAAQGHELPARVLDWRQLAKLKSTYTDALVAEIHPETGRVHTSYAMAVASTGRLSSTDPNLQNIPVRTEEGRRIREAFVPAEGCRLVSLDYSQIELRLLAHVAGMEVLKEAFRNGVDIHAMTASEVFGVPVEGMDPMVRRRAKAINFGIIYGISAFGLANQLRIERSEARRFIDAYFAKFPGIRDYMETTKDFARRNGWVATPFGRRIHVREINARNPSHRGFAERQAINAPLQGGAADIIKRAMIRVPAALEAGGLGARMLLQVHDELLFEVPEDEVEETVAALRPMMERAALPAVDLAVPLVVDAGAADNWAAAH